MATREVFSEVDRFAGYSDRSIPVQQTRIESPDCKNVEFAERVMQRRNGYLRMHTNMMRDSSVRLEGVQQYLRIPHQTTYIPTNKPFISIDVVLRGQPSAEVTIVQKGYGATSNLFFRLSYDPNASPNGGWYFRAYNGTSLQSALVADGSAAGGPLDLYRHCELYWSGTSNTYNVRVLDVDGTVIGSSTLTLPAFSTTTEDYTIGVGMSASDTLGTDFSNITAAEFRLGDSSSTSPVWAGIVDRELDSGPDSLEYTDLIGYWKLNDGRGSTVTDSAGSNPGIAGAEGPEWVTGSEIVGRSGLQFFGEKGFVLVDATAWSAGVFNDNSGGAGGYNDYRDWTISFCYTPKLAQGETTVRAGTLLWSGSHATNPAPIGITVADATGSGGTTSDIVITYQNTGATLDTTYLGIDLATYADTRIRVVVQYSGVTSGSEVILLRAWPESSATVYAKTFTVTGLGNPAVVTTGPITFGAKISTLTAPYTQSGSSIYGILDDLYFVDRPAVAGGTASIGPSVPITPLVALGGINGFAELDLPLLQATNGTNLNHEIVCGVRLNENGGNELLTLGARTSYAALYPAISTGVRWDIGIVEPYLAPQVDMIADYKTFTETGEAEVQQLCLSGTTLYKLSGLTMVPVAGDIHKDGKATYAQYQDKLLIARPNGRRPSVWDGRSLSLLGIAAPFAPLTVTASTSGGSIPDGQVWFYCTYRNTVTGEESNPSPAFSVTFSGGGTSSITDIAIPISTDPQVNERRVYVTGTSVEGSTAYLLSSLSDNVTTNITTSILALASVAPILTYLDNQEAPQGSVVETYKSRVLVSGNGVYPSRVWYTLAFQPGSFNHTDSYIDVDDNQGNPVRGLRDLSDSVAVVMNDRVAYLTETGDATTPFIRTFAGEGLDGGTGPLTIVPYANQLFILGERDLWLVDPSASLNLSSPVQEGRPAVSHTMRNEVHPQYRYEYSMAFHRSRNQLWLSYREYLDTVTRNNKILLFQFDQGIWSKYDLAMDIINEIEDVNDDPWIYGGAYGYLCKLDTNDWDGTPSVFAGSVTGGSTSSLQDSGANWVTDQLKGLEVYWYDASAGVSREARIRSNTSTEAKFYVAQVAPAIGDGYVFGGISWYADFVADFGSPLTLKRTRFMELSGESDNDQNLLRVSVMPNEGGRLASGYDSTKAVDFFAFWTTDQQFKRLRIGCLGRSFRLRIGDSGVADVTTEEPVPSLTGRIEIWPWVLRGEQVSAPG